MAESPDASANLRLTSVRKLRSAFGSRGRLTLSRGWLRRNVWIAPVVAMAALLFAGTWLRSHVERSIEAQVEGELRALLDADVTALKLWLHMQEANATAATQDPELRQAALDLLQFAAEHPSASELLHSPQRTQLMTLLKPWFESHGYAAYIVMDRQGRILSAKADTLVGT